MRTMVIGAALLALAAAPVTAQTTIPSEPVAEAGPAGSKDSLAKKPDFDISQMMAVFDKIFPAQPEPAPARLALARTTVNGLLPDGTYARMMDRMMHGVIDRAMGLTEADFAKGEGKAKPATATTTLGQKLAKDDPYFDERMKITERVMREEMGKVAAIIEPHIRDGLAHSIARRFDEKQLADINAFLATDSGKAFGSQSMAMWVDPDVLRSVMSSFPEIMKTMPDTMKRVETETARLPKPKKVEAKAKSKS